MHDGEGSMENNEELGNTGCLQFPELVQGSDLFTLVALGQLEVAVAHSKQLWAVVVCKALGRAQLLVADVLASFSVFRAAAWQLCCGSLNSLVE